MGESKFPEVLIVSIPGDSHASAVNWALRQRGVNSEVVFPGDMPDFGKISINIEGRSTDVIFRDREGTEVHTANVKLVWNRRVAFPPAPSRTHEHDRDVVRESYRNHVNNLRAVLTRQAVFINSPDVQYLANNKALQLATAAHVGFTVPRTRISNDFDNVVQAQEKYGKTITKMYYARLWRKDGDVFGAFTTLIDSIDPEDRTSIELCPVFYQEAIDYDSEVRLIAFDDNLYAMRMRRSDSDNGVAVDGVHDSRLLLNYGKFDCSVADVPDDVRRKVRDYMNELGLKFGAFDFLVSSEGEWIFLECNEGGQFLFLEDRLQSIELLKGFSGWIAAHVGAPEPKDAGDISLGSYYLSNDFNTVQAECENHNDFPAYAPIVEEDEHMQNARFSRYHHA